MNTRCFLYCFCCFLLLLLAPKLLLAQDQSMMDNFSFGAKPVITHDYLQQENFKYLSPEDYEGLMERGYYKLSQGNIDEAILDFESVVSGAPTYGGGYYAVGICYKVKGDTLQAEQFFKQSIAKDATFGPAYLELGDLLLDSEPEMAEQRYKAALQLMPESAEPLFRFGLLALMQEDVSKAKKHFKKALALEPGHLPVNFLMGQFYYAERKINEAIKAFGNCIAADAEHLEGYTWRAICFATKKKYPEALKDLDAGLQLDPENYLMYTLRGALHYDDKNYLEALKDFNKTFTLVPAENSDLKPNQGLYPRTEEYKALFHLVLEQQNSLTAEQLNKLARAACALLVNDYYESQRAAKSLFDEAQGLAEYIYGLTLEKTGKREEAIKYYKRCTNTSLAYLEALKRTATLQLDFLQQHDTALVTLKKVLMLDPEYVLGYKNIGNILMGQENFRLAVGYYNLAIQRDTTATDLLYNRASAYVYIKQYKAAIADLDRLLTLKPKDAGTWSLKGDIWLLLGDTLMAKEAYTHSLKYKYNSAINFKRGLILLEQKAYADALEDFKVVEKYAHDYKAAQLNMANCLLNLKEYLKALEILNDYSRKNPDEPIAFVLMGFCFQGMNNPDSAIKYFIRAKELGYEGLESLINH